MVYEVHIIDSSDDESVFIIQPPPKRPKPPVLTINLDSDEDNRTKVQNKIGKRKKQSHHRQKEQPKEKNRREEYHTKTLEPQKTNEKKRLKKKPKEVNLENLFKPDFILPKPPPPPPPLPKTTTISTISNNNNNCNTNNLERTAATKKTLSSPTFSLTDLSEGEHDHFKFIQDLNKIANIGLSVEEALRVAQIELPNQTAKKKTSQTKDTVQQQQSSVGNSNLANGNKSKSSSTSPTSSSKYTSSSKTGSKVVKDTISNSSFKNTVYHKNSIGSKDKEVQGNAEIINSSVNNHNGKSNNSDITSHKNLNHLQINAESKSTTASSPSTSSSTLPTKSTAPKKSSVLQPCQSNMIFLCPEKVWNYEKCRGMLMYLQKLEKDLGIKIQRQISKTEGKGIIILSGISFVGVLDARSKISEWLENHNLEQPNRGPLTKSSSTSLAVTTSSTPSTSSTVTTTSSTLSTTTTTSSSTVTHPKKNSTSTSTSSTVTKKTISSRSEVGVRKQNNKSPISFPTRPNRNKYFPPATSVFGGARQRRDFPSAKDFQLAASSTYHNRNKNTPGKVLEETKLFIEDKVWYSNVEQIPRLMISFRNIVTHLDVSLQPKINNCHLSLEITSCFKNGNVFRAKKLIESDIQQKYPKIPPLFKTPNPVFQYKKKHNNNYSANKEPRGRTNNTRSGNRWDMPSSSSSATFRNGNVSSNFNHNNYFQAPPPLPPPPPVTFNGNPIPSLWSPRNQHFTPPFFPSQWNNGPGYANFY